MAGQPTNARPYNGQPGINPCAPIPFVWEHPDLPTVNLNVPFLGFDYSTWVDKYKMVNLPPWTDAEPSYSEDLKAVCRLQGSTVATGVRADWWVEHLAVRIKFRKLYYNSARDDFYAFWYYEPTGYEQKVHWVPQYNVKRTVIDPGGQHYEWDTFTGDETLIHTMEFFRHIIGKPKFLGSDLASVLNDCKLIFGIFDTPVGDAFKVEIYFVKLKTVIIDPINYDEPKVSQVQIQHWEGGSWQTAHTTGYIWADDGSSCLLSPNTLGDTTRKAHRWRVRWGESVAGLSAWSEWTSFYTMPIPLAKLMIEKMSSREVIISFEPRRVFAPGAWEWHGDEIYKAPMARGYPVEKLLGAEEDGKDANYTLVNSLGEMSSLYAAAYWNETSEYVYVRTSDGRPPSGYAVGFCLLVEIPYRQKTGRILDGVFEGRIQSVPKISQSIDNFPAMGRQESFGEVKIINLPASMQESAVGALYELMYAGRDYGSCGGRYLWRGAIVRIRLVGVSPTEGATDLPEIDEDQVATLAIGYVQGARG